MPTLADIERARALLDGVARVTPVYGSETFSRLVGREVQLKAENLQRTGSFKTRGAVNKLASLGETERAAGVVAASAGNHAQAVAWAAREAGVRATIFVPQDAPMAKVEATRSYGANVEMGGEALEEAITTARRYVEETGGRSSTPTRTTSSSPGRGRSGSSSPSRCHRRRPSLCRSAGRPRGGDRDGTEGGEAGAKSSACAPRPTALRSRTGSR